MASEWKTIRAADFTGLPSSDHLFILPIDHSQLKTQGNALMQVSLFSAEKSED